MASKRNLARSAGHNISELGRWSLPLRGKLVYNGE
jgi:hypothetical protein